MTLILVAHHSHEGQTAKIAARVSERLRASGCEVVEVDVADAPAPVAFDAVVAGDSIRFERHSRALVRYLRRCRTALEATPLALFQVSMTSARTDDEHVALADQMFAELVSKTGVRPKLRATFAGAIRYTDYGWVTKRVMRSIARREGNATDTSRDHEYTDWVAVDRFADDVVAMATAVGAS